MADKTISLTVTWGLTGTLVTGEPIDSESVKLSAVNIVNQKLAGSNIGAYVENISMDVDSASFMLSLTGEE